MSGRALFRWYNHEHRPQRARPSSRPAVVHYGRADTARAHRQEVLATAYAAHPERFVKGRPQPADLRTAVWINPPEKIDAPGCPGTTKPTRTTQRSSPFA